MATLTLLVAAASVLGALGEGLIGAGFVEAGVLRLPATLLAAALALTGSILFIRWVGPRPYGRLLGVGAAWALLAVVLHGAMVLLAAEEGREALGAAYDPRTGSLWILMPLILLAAPSLVGALRRRRIRAKRERRAVEHDPGLIFTVRRPGPYR